MVQVVDVPYFFQSLRFFFVSCCFWINFHRREKYQT
jgi:hypothetical protein